MRRSVAIGAVLLAVCFLVLYVLTLSPGVYLGDSGELAAAGALLDIPHPPGYPLYALLARLFVAAGFGPIAARANALSAFAAAVSIAFFLLLARSRFSATAALLGALLLGFSSLLWSQAAVAEVYALHLAFFLLFLLVVSHADSARRRLSAAWIGGLAATAHPLGVGLLPLLLVAGWTTGGEGRSRRALLLQAFAFLAPLSLFLYLPIRSASDPPTDWGNPETARAFWSHVLRLGYREVPKPAASLSLWYGEMVALIRGAAGNIGAPLLALAPLGLFSPALRRRRGLLLPLAGFLLYGPLLAAYLRFPLAPERVEENSVFFLPALALLLLFVSSGADLLLAACRGRRSLRIGLIATFCAVAAVRFGSALPAHRYDQVALPEAYARDVLTGVPSGATLVAAGDDMVFPLLFLQRVEGVRPDVDLRDADGIVFPAPGEGRAGGRYFTFPAPGLAPAGLHFVEAGAKAARPAEPIALSRGEERIARRSTPLRSLWTNYCETRARSEPDIARAAPLRLAALALSGEPVSPIEGRALRYAEATLHVERGSEEAAFSILRSILAESDDDVLPRLLLAEIEAERGRKAEAVRLLDSISAASTGTLVRSARLLLDLGEVGASRERLREAVRRGPPSTEALLLLRRIAVEEGDAKEAARLEKRAREIDPLSVAGSG